MKNIVWVLVFALAGCHKEPGPSFGPSQLMGTWNSLATLPSPTEKRFTRWTFTSEYVYLLEDTLETCQPINNNSNYNYSYKYWIENNTLVLRYAGFTTGLFPIPDIRWRIIAITEAELVLDGAHHILKKCP